MGERKLVKETTTHAYTGPKPTVEQFKKGDEEMLDYAQKARARAVERMREGRRGKDRK